MSETLKQLVEDADALIPEQGLKEHYARLMFVTVPLETIYRMADEQARAYEFVTKLIKELGPHIEGTWLPPEIQDLWTEFKKRYGENADAEPEEPVSESHEEAQPPVPQQDEATD